MHDAPVLVACTPVHAWRECYRNALGCTSLKCVSREPPCNEARAAPPKSLPQVIQRCPDSPADTRCSAGDDPLVTAPDAAGKFTGCCGCRRVKASLPFAVGHEAAAVKTYYGFEPLVSLGVMC